MENTKVSMASPPCAMETQDSSPGPNTSGETTNGESLANGEDVVKESTSKPQSPNTDQETDGAQSDEGKPDNPEGVQPIVYSLGVQPPDVVPKKGPKRERGLVLNSDDYELVVNLLSRKHPIPVKERTPREKRLYTKISRHGLTVAVVYDPFLDSTLERIIVKGKILLPRDQVGSCIKKVHEWSKGERAKKLQGRLTDTYFGIGRKTIQNILESDPMYKLKSPKFLKKSPLKNLAPSRPFQQNTIINAPAPGCPMRQHQIDVVDLSQIAVTVGDVTYKYVLALIDVFSRFLWLRAMADRSPRTVCVELRKLYLAIGYPMLLHCDRGTEFTGEVEEFCREKEIQLIRSNTPHLQSQGKMARCHASWKSKIEFDVRNGEYNWVQNLNHYQELYNTGIHSALNMSPYECYVGIRPGCAEQASQMEVLEKQAKAHQHDTQRNKHHGASTETGVDLRYKEHVTNLCSKAKKRSVINTMLRMTRQSATPPAENSREKLTANAREQGLQVEKENDGGGNCMFLALSQQLEKYGLQRAVHRIRKEVVEYMANNSLRTQDGQEVDLMDFISDHDSIESYLNHMNEDGSWGDHLILIAFANLFKTNIYIVSSVSSEPIIIEPSSGPGEMSIALGHVHEVHYLSLCPIDNGTVSLRLIEKCKDCGTKWYVESDRRLCGSCGQLACNLSTHLSPMGYPSNPLPYVPTSNDSNCHEVLRAQPELEHAIMHTINLFQSGSSNENQVQHPPIPRPEFMSMGPFHP